MKFGSEKERDQLLMFSRFEVYPHTKWILSLVRNIFVDRGMGMTIIKMIKKYSLDMGDGVSYFYLVPCMGMFSWENFCENLIRNRH